MTQLPVHTSTNEQGTVTSSRALSISHSLRTASRKVRDSSRVWVPARSRQRRWERFWRPSILTGFAILVVIPSVIAAFYLSFLMSDQYASEVKFAVRGGELPVSDVASRLAALSPMARIQDSLILSEYIQSRGMVEELQKTINLREIYSDPKIDYFSRFNASEPVEKLVEYWKGQTDVHIEDASGIITVDVRAFVPEHALIITRAIIAAGERLVNQLSERSRGDTLRRARDELDRAQTQLQRKVQAMRDLRNVEGVLDTKYTAEAMTKLLAELRLDQARLQQEYSAQRETVAPDAPQLRVLAARIRSMREQIKELEAKLTNASGTSAQVLADTMSKFDLHQLERNLAEQQYIAAAAAYEQARIEIEGQRVYLATFLKPVLAEEALYPMRGVIWLVIFFAAITLWGCLVGIATLVRNYVAI